MATQEATNTQKPTVAKAPPPKAGAPPRKQLSAAAPSTTPAPAKPSRHRRLRLLAFMRSYGSFMVSSAFHALVILILAWLSLPQDSSDPVTEVVVNNFEDEIVDEEILKVELQERIEASTQMTVAVAAIDPVVGVAGSGGSPGSMSQPVMDAKLTEQLEGDEIKIDAPALSIPSSKYLIDEIPEGALGEERAIVDNYEQAMSQITKEILWMLDRSNVLVIWCFDMSESMKDDQKEIRDRIDQVYTELGQYASSKNGRLTSAVTAYGGNPPEGRGFIDITRGRPTSVTREIRDAIDLVPIDPSGDEMMCTAVGKSIARYRDYVKKEKRQVALILVTDESGNRKDNDQFLEAAIAEAQAAKCKVYALGREASFGYPHARFRWQHPETGRIHWLLVDRGPETAFAEQLQTNGFHRRWDYFSSGFGPYEQTRLAKQTNGIFFMLPSIELDLVGVTKRRYELEAMRSYKPDLRPKIDIFADIEAYPLRGLLMKVVDDLNPLASDEKARLLEMRVHFSLIPADFIRQTRESQRKALAYLDYLARAEKALIDNARLREQEVSPRWMANYDLMLAQLVAYQARMYEYGVYLDYFIANPKTAPAKKAPNLTLVHWDIAVRKRVLAEDMSLDYPQRDAALSYMERAKGLFQDVIDKHPGTPWAERAQWELNRGFGVELVPDYDPPYTPVSNPSPVPKL